MEGSQEQQGQGYENRAFAMVSFNDIIKVCHFLSGKTYELHAYAQTVQKMLNYFYWSTPVLLEAHRFQSKRLRIGPLYSCKHKMYLVPLFFAQQENPVAVEVQQSNGPTPDATKDTDTGLLYAVDDTPAWYTCLFLGVQVCNLNQ